LLWLGAAISIAEIVTGGMLAPLGWFRASMAIILGHLLGTFFLAFGGYISFKRKKNAMDAASWSLGLGGGKLAAFANVIQLTGWTLIMVVQAAEVFQEIFTWIPPSVMALIISFLVICWALILNSPLNWLNNAAVVLLALLCLCWFAEVLWPGPGFMPSMLDQGAISFVLGLELSMAMPISWLPLVGDYSKKSKNTMQAAICPFLGYFLGSVLMYFLGLVLALNSGKDIFAFIAGSQLRIPAMVIVILSTLTSAFLDLNSAAVSCQVLTGLKKEKSLILLIGLIAALMSALFPSSSYFDYLTSLLLLIGMVFVPVYAAIFIDYLFKCPKRNSIFPAQTVIPVICGLIAHYLSSRYFIWIPSLLSMIVVLFCYLLLRIFSPAREKSSEISSADCEKTILT